MDDMLTFQQDLLAKLAKAMGITLEDLTAEPEGSYAEAAARAADWHRRYLQWEEYRLAELRAIMLPIVLAIYTEIAFDATVRWLLGYDPQLLLEPPSFERDFKRSMEAWARHVQTMSFAEMSELYIPSGGLVTNWPEYSPVIPVETRVMYMAVDVAREGPPVVVIHLGDFEGEVPGLTSLIVDESIDYRFERRVRDWPLHMKVEPLRREPGYLQHDPTKNHRRRRRK